jgi:hypothetical protein
MKIFIYILCPILLGISLGELNASCNVTAKIASPPMYKTDSTLRAIVHITGGNEPFTYFWGNETTRDYCTLPKGAQTITVTVTDLNGCVVRDTLIIE